MDLGLSYKDWARIAWTFVQGALAWMVAASAGWVPGSAVDWRAVLIGALAAGWSTVKNLVLADSSPIK
jgi:hypothetical protein